MSKEAGKGSSPRPYSVTQQEYDTRWDMIFGRDKPKEKEETPKEPIEEQEQQK